LSAAHGVPYLGIVSVVVLLILHLCRVPRPVPELKLMVLVALIGGAWESAVLFFGLLDYPQASIHGMAPLWLPALWASFAAQFNTTYRWLKPRLWAGALLGAVAGPLSFRAGAALGALRFVKPFPAAITLALGWAVMLPLIILLSRRWDGVDA
jgi:hypothetical protein